VTLSMYKASVPVFVQGMTNLSAIMAKAAAQASERKIDPAVLLNSRLASDMYPLVRQVQIASDHAKAGTARLAGIEVPRFEDVEKDFEELLRRLAGVRDFIQGVDPARIDGSEDRDINVPLGGQTVTFKGQPYLLQFILPNFFFHLVTAYDILRHNGIAIGKRDFIGRIS
jgi:uncharacterized protein